jgi:hypothetical protein
MFEKGRPPPLRLRGPFGSRRSLALRRRPAGRLTACRLASGRPAAAPAHRLRRAPDAGLPLGCRAAGRRLARCLATSRRLARRRFARRRLATGGRLLPRRLPSCRLPCCRLARRRLPCCRLPCCRLARRCLAGRRLATGCGPLARRGAGFPCRSLTRSRHWSPPFASAGWRDVSPAKG